MATIIVLDGTSSSGKTSIAKALQELLPRVTLNFSIDSILYALPGSALERIKRGADISDLRYPELVRAYYACVRELAALGHDLVIDHAIVSRNEADLLLAAIESHRTFLVGLTCPVEILAERERDRGDRRPGMAAAQSRKVHQWLQYDLFLDTSTITPAEAARRVAATLETRMNGS